jgi:predicted ATP-dependent protease
MADARETFKIPLATLAPQVDGRQLGFSDTSELSPVEEPIGQERAVESLDFGLRIKSPGFNIYASGPTGTGKRAVIRRKVQALARLAPAPPDWCYVNNFKDASRPRCLWFPAGEGRAFKQALARLVQGMQHDIPTLFESTKYLEARAKVIEENETKKKVLFKEITELAHARGFGFQDEPVGFSLVTIREGKPISEEDLGSLGEAEQKAINEGRAVLESKLREFQARVHALDHETEHRMHEMDRQVVRSVLMARMAPLKDAYQQLGDVLDHLSNMEEDIVANYRDFIPRHLPLPPFVVPEAVVPVPSLTRYQVNVIVEHASGNGAPIVEESHPTYANLVGRLERRAHMGIMFTDFTEIKAGALLQASGGFLILNILDLLRQPYAWDALCRVIKTREVKVEDPGEFFGFATVGIKPQPIAVDIKVILLGPPMIFSLLQTYDEEFAKIFKVRADFDVDVARDAHFEQLYARFVAKLCRDENLPHFGADAVAEVIRQGLRLAERHDRLSLRLSILSDVIREAAFYARHEGRTLVAWEDVEQAVVNKRRRSDLPEQWIQDEIKEGTLLVDLEGEVVGQVNGLSVHVIGDYAFGRPCRITARTFVGTKGVIDIQREAELSGHIHSKGVMTLAGFLAGKFAGSHPFALNATLTFEQTYSEVEGDSAAVAELCAILSSLAEAPMRQALAVTGSANQLGEVQPIGGVNEKIEGFFESCRKHGLTGEQGVIIPAKNTKHLALRREVVEAVAAGKFAIYGVTRVEEAIELLTGVPAGERGADGLYPEDSLYGRAAQKLAEMAEIVSAWGEHGRAQHAT